MPGRHENGRPPVASPPRNAGNSEGEAFHTERLPLFGSRADADLSRLFCDPPQKTRAATARRTCRSAGIRKPPHF